MSQPVAAAESRCADVIHTRRGEVAVLRAVSPSDADALQAYVRGLTPRSRYNRFLGAMSELPPKVLDDFVGRASDDRVTLLVTMHTGGGEAVIGEARYAFHRDTGSVEFGLSVADRWQGHGIGPALLQHIACRAAALGAWSLYGDTLRSNDVMITLAKASGFTLRQHPDDWTLVRFAKDAASATLAPPGNELRVVSKGGQSDRRRNAPTMACPPLPARSGMVVTARR